MWDVMRPLIQSVTHRLGGQMGNSSAGLAPLNIVYDFRPDKKPVTKTRNIAMTASCNECHGRLVVHGRRFEVGYCVTCHNPGLSKATTLATCPL